MGGSPDWGVPDWLRPQDYPVPKGPAAMAIWAWEFLRRNKKFRDFWLNKVESFMRADGRIGRNPTGRFWPYHKEMQGTFGIMDPRSPRQNSRIPPFCDCATKFVAAPAEVYELLAAAPAPVHCNPFVPASPANTSREMLLERANLELAWFEMGFAIDLSLPLDDQFKVIRMLAEESQLTLMRAERVDLKTARTSDQYARYLRILDAEDIGASRSVIADALYPDIDNIYPEHRRLKAFENGRREARRLRDSGYRALAHRAMAPMADAALGP